MPSKTGFAAIGMGGRLSGLVEMLLRDHGDKVEMRAMADESRDALAAASKRFGTGPAAFTDFRKTIDRPDVDWVLIGSINSLHKPHCLAAFSAKKHVFCEKPLGITIKECRDIRKAHKRSGRTFMTGFVLRYAPLYRKVHEIVGAGTLGRIISMEANENLHFNHGGYIMRGWRRLRAKSGPHLLEKCSHDIDLLNWMTGSVASSAACFGGTDIFTPENKAAADRLARPDDDPPLYKSWWHWEDADPFLSNKDVEDNLTAIMEFRSGARVMFHTNACNAIPQRRMLICGLEGTLEADLWTSRVRWQRIGRKEKLEELSVGPAGGHGGGDELIMADLARCMRTRGEPEVSGEEGFKSAVTCLAVDEARRKNKIVDLEPYWREFGV